MPLPPAPDMEGLGAYNLRANVANANVANTLTNMSINQQQEARAQQMAPGALEAQQIEIAAGRARAPYQSALASLPMEKEARARESAKTAAEIAAKKTRILQQQADIKQQIATLLSDPNSPQNKNKALGYLVQYERLDEELRAHDSAERMARYNAGFVDSPYAPPRPQSDVAAMLRQYAMPTQQVAQPQQQPQQPQQTQPQPVAPQARGPQGQMVTTDEQGRRVVIPQSEQATASAAYDAGQRGERVSMTPPDPLMAPREQGRVPDDLMKLPVAARMKAYNARMDEVPAQTARLNGAAAALDQVADTAKLILSHESLPAATGLIGTVTTKIPGFGPYNVAQIIESLEAKLAFASLGDLRQQSKTGGALGQVSDAEEQMLKKAIASVKLAQSESDVRRALTDVVNYSDAAKDRLTRAYEQTYAAPPDLTEYHTVTARKSGGPKIGEVKDGYSFKGGDPSKQENWTKVK